MACSAMTFKREPREDQKGHDIVDLQKASDKVFQFTYLEEQDAVEQRFRVWLEKAIIVALDRWQKSL